MGAQDRTTNKNDRQINSTSRCRTGIFIPFLQSINSSTAESVENRFLSVFGVRAGEVGAGDHAGPLGEEVVTALHCGKHMGAKWYTTLMAAASRFLSAMVQFSQWF